MCVQKHIITLRKKIHLLPTQNFNKNVDLNDPNV